MGLRCCGPRSEMVHRVPLVVCRAHARTSKIAGVHHSSYGIGIIIMPSHRLFIFLAEDIALVAIDQRWAYGSQIRWFLLVHRRRAAARVVPRDASDRTSEIILLPCRSRILRQRPLNLPTTIFLQSPPSNLKAPHRHPRPHLRQLNLPI